MKLTETETANIIMALRHWRTDLDKHRQFPLRRSALDFTNLPENFSLLQPEEIDTLINRLSIPSLT